MPLYPQSRGWPEFYKGEIWRYCFIGSWGPARLYSTLSLQTLQVVVRVVGVICTFCHLCRSVGPRTVEPAGQAALGQIQDYLQIDFSVFQTSSLWAGPLPVEVGEGSVRKVRRSRGKTTNDPVYRTTRFSLKAMEWRIKMYILCWFDACTYKHISVDW